MSDIKAILRPVLQTFSRGQLVVCFKLPRLPRGDLASPEWIFCRTFGGFGGFRS
jgi:hypothetical protein